MMEVWIAVRASHSVSLATAIHYFINFLWFLHHLFMPEASKRYCSPNSSAVDALGWVVSPYRCLAVVAMSRSDGGGSPASKDSGQVQRALADLDGESDASSVASVRGLVAGWVMVKKCCLNHWCVRFASSFTFIFPSLSGPGDGRCRPNLGSLSEVYLGLFSNGSMVLDGPKLSQHLSPARSDGGSSDSASSAGGGSFAWTTVFTTVIATNFLGFYLYEILHASHLRPCNHPCGQSPCMLLWPCFDGAEQHQANASKNCLTRSGITYSAASSASTVTEAIIMNFKVWIGGVAECNNF